ncbi:hypothetical protein QR680_005680 [Steinernema hermaphroditum]|uniref:Uncharacterized protein n=1 Tax=Steinernema hermaphroditum TaxID=289476 RepID=A0AA39HT00_9BILA|nr:hypothetical protein QR680_005680 [Steinernema hermaphroditum]
MTIPRLKPSPLRTPPASSSPFHRAGSRRVDFSRVKKSPTPFKNSISSSPSQSTAARRRSDLHSISMADGRVETKSSVGLLWPLLGKGLLWSSSAVHNVGRAGTQRE